MIDLLNLWNKMKILSGINFKVLFLFVASAGLLTAQTLIVPVSDGTLYPVGGADTGDYIYVDNGPNPTEGALVFSTASTLPYDNFSVEINPYGEPMYTNTINVYGYGSSVGTLSSSDYGQGTLLGTFTNLSS